MTHLLILAPLRIEARALRRGLGAAEEASQGSGRSSPAPASVATVVRVGMGPKAAARTGEGLPAVAGGDPVVIAGFGGGLQPGFRTGDIIVADQIRGPGQALLLPSAPDVAEILRSAGLTVHVGPILSSPHSAFGPRRARAAVGGSIGIDMESYWLLQGYAADESDTAPREGGAAPGQLLPGRLLPGHLAVVRAVSDSVGEGFLGGMLPRGWLRAYRSLEHAAAALEGWAARTSTEGWFPQMNT
jgi:4-hydroxy-3-methylbut-2-en-1-yl diphosphate reductase